MHTRPEVLIAGAALALSILSLVTGAWFTLRGSVVSAVTPDSVFFYRDAGAGGAVLSAGVDTALVNTASANHGDVVTRITMEIDRPGDADPAFDYENLVAPVFSETAARQAADCPVSARCVLNGRFLAIEEPRRTLDVPGGASRSEYVGFLLNDSNCARKGQCPGFRDFASASQSIDRGDTLTVRFRYYLQSDGEKVAVCRINLHLDETKPYRPWLAEQLSRAGWVGLPCAREAPKSTIEMPSFAKQGY